MTNPSRIQVQLHLKSAWRIRHGHWAEAELPFDPSKLEATWHFNGQPIEGIKLWGSLEGSKEGQKIYQWGIKSRFAWLHPFDWNKEELWSLELTPKTDSSNTSWRGNTMSEKAEADAGEIEAFARSLDLFSKTLRDQMRQLSAKQKQLSATWRDDTYERYVPEFEQAMKMLDKFIQASEKQVPHLRKRVQKIRDYRGS
jgi:uncharacterized protein YukE